MNQIKNYKSNSLTHVLEIYKFYNELVELIMSLSLSLSLHFIQRRSIICSLISIVKSSIFFIHFQLYIIILIYKPMHKVKSYDILWFCIKYTLFLHVLVPNKTYFLDHPLNVPLSDVSTYMISDEPLPAWVWKSWSMLWQSRQDENYN